MLNMIAKPFIDNKDLLKSAIEGSLKVIETVTSGILSTIQTLGDLIQKLYDEHLKPFFDSIANGISSISKTTLTVYNTYILPVLQGLADKLKGLMTGTLGETLAKIETFLGKIIDVLKLLWENILVPLINWIIANVVPVLAKIADMIGTKVINIVKTLIKVIGDIVPVGVGWQYSEHGKVSGISGNVDMDVFYKDYRGATQKGETTVAKTKLQKFLELGDYYASNGGYLEKKSDAYLDDFKKNAGYNNYTRFARDVNSWGQPGCQAQPWCAEYQFWKLVKVLGITRALQIMGGGFYNCKSITNHAKSNGTWHKSPKVGALIIFRNGSHVGSARSFNGSVVYTNEGNTSSAAGVVANGGAVRNKSYAINDSAIDGYVWIDWGSEGQTAAWKATGTATSTADDLYVRESPNGYVLGKINKGNRVEINGEKSGAWTKIKVAGIGIGWVATKYLAVDGAKNVAATATVIVKKQDKNQRLYTGQVTASSLNVRTWAGAEYPNIKKYPTLNKGNKVDVMNFTQKASDGSSWYYIRIAGKYFGFVSAKYIKKV